MKWVCIRLPTLYQSKWYPAHENNINRTYKASKLHILFLLDWGSRVSVKNFELGFIIVVEQYQDHSFAFLRPQRTKRIYDVSLLNGKVQRMQLELSCSLRSPVYSDLCMPKCFGTEKNGHYKYTGNIKLETKWIDGIGRNQHSWPYFDKSKICTQNRQTSFRTLNYILKFLCYER